MEAMILHRTLARRPRELATWQLGALGLLALSLAWNMGQTALFAVQNAALRETEARLAQTELARDYAIEQLGAAALQAERDRQARAEQAAAYEAIGAYQYIGECTVTAYCPCVECCGSWADGLTATGLPAAPGIVAVDPEVIPLGSTVIIDGQKYLAADTGVTGLAVDICCLDHQEADAFGVQTAAVWIETEGGSHG